ncbi:MAG: DEAD/DEAH box helicase family protein [Bacteroidaceae bacterium]|nr:DEAD/DEAH box helicase family protein [Bacteroidaceae bacterium]
MAVLSATFADIHLSEEDIKSRYIQPALEDKGWDKEHMRLEFTYTAGQIVVQGSMKHRKRGKRVDYLLYTEDNYPIAVVEAKDRKHAPADGIQQAIDYAHDLDLPFAYACNGEKFVEHDMNTGAERTFDMDDFPTPLSLRERHRQWLFENKHLSEEGAQLLDIPYYSDSDSFPPRYYQRIAINKVIEAVACGKNRILLVMATGTGKTYTAFQIIHRLHASGRMKRILYLADRNILIDQTMRQDFKPFRKVMSKVQGKSAESGFEIYMSLYGQWVKNDSELQPGERQPYENYAKDFFDLIVVDECHRSSINEDKEWHKILTYFDKATQIGLTATPKSVEGADNFEYFGLPVYTYSLNQGIADGYLAPYRVTKSFINVDMEGYVTEEGEQDLFGQDIEESIFTRNSFGREIHITKRQKVVAYRITQMLKLIGRMTKTIVFCPDQEEAAIMRELLIAMNQDMVRKYPDYVVRITSDDRVGKSLLDNFIDPYEPCPVIATTSELLTTGVDCKTCGLIVIDKEVNNPTTFKQMIGRGTRIFEKKEKMNFEILDFRGATLLFEKGFDQEDTPTNDYCERKIKKYDVTEDDESYQVNDDMEEYGEAAKRHKKYHVDGHDIKIVHEVVQFLGEDGKTLFTERLTDFTRKAIKKHYPTLDAFRGAWAQADKKQAIIDELAENNVLLDAVREENPDLADCDYFDIICHVAFDQKPLTRKERIEGVKKRNYLAKYEGQARKVIEGLMEKYGEVGVTNIENPQILSLNPFAQIAKRPRIMKGIFKSPEEYNEAVRDLENELYNVG